ncbi:MAG: hypothetical protein GF417_11120, partial [Candidatus Latescibacteria bacterium]|nr:hypothetical protein [Candidatus Latescibacterota bacterium]
MIIATHQPLFMPWPGLFYKAIEADMLILLDQVQFPTGSSFITRNRLKDEDGPVWLIVPVWRKNLGLQRINEVRICYQRRWIRKHLNGIRQNYSNAPYRDLYLQRLAEIYRREHKL